MNIRAGEFLVSNRDGGYYRVVECRDNIVSLKRVNGYTLFACNPQFLEFWFRPVQASLLE